MQKCTKKNNNSRIRDFNFRAARRPPVKWVRVRSVGNPQEVSFPIRGWDACEIGTTSICRSRSPASRKGAQTTPQSATNSVNPHVELREVRCSSYPFSFASSNSSCKGPSRLAQGRFNTFLFGKQNALRKVIRSSQEEEDIYSLENKERRALRWNDFLKTRKSIKSLLSGTSAKVREEWRSSRVGLLKPFLYEYHRIIFWIALY